MQSVGQQLIIAAIPILPALVFFVLVLTGRLFKENAQYIAILGVTVSLVFSVFALLFVARHPWRRTTHRVLGELYRPWRGRVVPRGRLHRWPRGGDARR